MIAYMTTTPQGRNLGRQLSRGRNGKNFNEATSRLYTSKDVLQRLEESYEAEQKRRDGQHPPEPAARQ
jgi:hypothetical protein